MRDLKNLWYKLQTFYLSTKLQTFFHLWKEMEPDIWKNLPKAGKEQGEKFLV